MEESLDPDIYRLEKLRQLSGQYEVGTANVLKLRDLEEFKIICICDDSGSMTTSIDENLTDPFAKRKSRWDELRETMNIIVEFGTCLDATGVDLYFLNRAPVLQVTSTAQVQQAFALKPFGFTPIVPVLNQVLAARMGFAEKRVLIVLATDGKPTDDSGNPNEREFMSLASHLPAGVFLSVLACSDSDEDMAYLKQLNGVARVCVTDDFRTEKQQYRQATGATMSFGDYITKAIAGSVRPESSSMNNPPKPPRLQHSPIFSPPPSYPVLPSGTVVSGNVAAGAVSTGIVTGLVAGTTMVASAPSAPPMFDAPALTTSSALTTSTTMTTSTTPVVAEVISDMSAKTYNDLYGHHGPVEAFALEMTEPFENDFVDPASSSFFPPIQQQQQAVTQQQQPGVFPPKVDEIDLTANVMNSRNLVAGNVSVHLQYKAAERLLQVSHVHVRNIANRTFFGKNDLYVACHWCGEVMKTKVAKGAGESALFDVPLLLLAHKNTIISDFFQLNVFCQNQITEDTLAGTYQVNLAHFLRRPHIPAHITDQNVEVLTSVLSKPSVSNNKSDGFGGATVLLAANQSPYENRVINLRFVHIRGMKVKMFASNNLFLVIEWRGQQFSTPVFDNASSDHKFTLNMPLMFLTPPTTPGLEQIKVTAMNKHLLWNDENMGSCFFNVPMV